MVIKKLGSDGPVKRGDKAAADDELGRLPKKPRQAAPRVFEYTRADGRGKKLIQSKVGKRGGDLTPSGKLSVEGTILNPVGQTGDKMAAARRAKEVGGSYIEVDGRYYVLNHEDAQTYRGIREDSE